MAYRRLGKSGLLVSPIGFGAFKIGRNQKIKYPQPHDLPDERAAAALLNGVLALGINYIDTAPAYGLSEERIGQALAARRDEFVLSTKAGETFAGGQSVYDFSVPAITASIARSLRLLRTDHLDIVFLHAHHDDVAIQRDTAAVETLQSLRSAGQVRAIGLSATTVAGAQQALAWADVLMVEYHPNDCSFAAVLEEARAADVGIVVKKGLGAGRIEPRLAIPFVLRQPAVGSLVIGGLSLEHMRINVAIARDAGLWTAGEEEATRETKP